MTSPTIPVPASPVAKTAAADAVPAAPARATHEISTVCRSRSGAGWRYVPSCRTHGCSTAETFPTAREAVDLFVCDGGTGARYIVEQGGPARMLDLTGVRRALVAFVEGRTYQWSTGSDELRVWLWDGTGRAQPLMTRCARPAEFDERDYAHPRWVIEDRDGTTHLSVTVRIDGRALHERNCGSQPDPSNAGGPRP